MEWIDLASVYAWGVATGLGIAFVIKWWHNR